jgi:hypothetical protein
MRLLRKSIYANRFLLKNKGAAQHPKRDNGRVYYGQLLRKETP